MSDRQQGDIAFIRGCLEQYYASFYFATVAKEPPFEAVDGGAPPEMWKGQPDEEGWVEWTMLPSTVGDDDLDNLEREYGVTLPALLRAYFKTYFHMFDQVKGPGFTFFIPVLPSDAPLKSFRQWLTAWRPLLSAGYLPVGTYEDGWGPICLDLASSPTDPPAVWFDHEELFNLGEGSASQRNLLAPLQRPLFSSFRELLRALGGGQSA